VPQHDRCEETELLFGKVAAAPGQLLAGDMPAHFQAGLQELDGGEDKEVRPLVILPPAGANAGHHVLGQL
jgi:hypothetical protein